MALGGHCHRGAGRFESFLHTACSIFCGSYGLVCRYGACPDSCIESCRSSNGSFDNRLVPGRSLLCQGPVFTSRSPDVLRIHASRYCIGTCAFPADYWFSSASLFSVHLGLYSRSESATMPLQYGIADPTLRSHGNLRDLLCCDRKYFRHWRLAGRAVARVWNYDSRIC